MRSVDTNVIVRFLTGDDPDQAERARAAMKQPVFLPRTVLLEAEWVLRSIYRLPPTQIIRALRAVVGIPSVTLDDPPIVARALEWAEAGMDFADALHLSGSDGCEAFLTFDERFLRLGSRVANIAVQAP